MDLVDTFRLLKRPKILKWGGGGGKGVAPRPGATRSHLVKKKKKKSDNGVICYVYYARASAEEEEEEEEAQSGLPLGY
jgi:hypothetical protein